LICTAVCCTKSCRPDPFIAVGVGVDAHCVWVRGNLSRQNRKMIEETYPGVLVSIDVFSRDALSCA
jgi:hypothetical protein